MIRRSALIALCLVSLAVPAAQVVVRCNLGTQPGRRIELVRWHRIADTYLYGIRQNGVDRPVFADVPDVPDGSRGSSVHAACVGRGAHALVVSGEFYANYLQGFVLTAGQGASIQRLDFAERARPGWLYLGKRETKVVMRTDGHGDTSQRYVVYSHVNDRGPDVAATGLDTLPAAEGFEVVRLR